MTETCRENVPLLFVLFCLFELSYETQYFAKTGSGQTTYGNARGTTGPVSAPIIVAWSAGLSGKSAGVPGAP
jgi:hypothetical protein